MNAGFDGDTLRRLYEQYRGTFRTVREKRVKAEIDRIKADLAKRVDEFDRYVVECRLNGATWASMARTLGTSEGVLKRSYEKAIREGLAL